MNVRLTLAALAVSVLTTGAAAAGTAGVASAAPTDPPVTTAAQAGPGAGANARHGDLVRLALTPSTPELAKCMPKARVDVAVSLRTDRDGRDIFHIEGRDLPPNRDYTVFLLEQAGNPFGAAEYIGDLHADAQGRGRNDFALIVQEAFASTLVNGQRVRVDLNRVGMWFADPKDDDFCTAEPGVTKVTPFDGDNEAGVQAFNSANAVELPAP